MSKKQSRVKGEDKKTKRTEDLFSPDELSKSISNSPDKEENTRTALSQASKIKEASIGVSNYEIEEPSLTEIIIQMYDGEKSDGHFEGNGKAIFTNGNIYEGKFVEGMMHGHGTYTWIREGVIYEGDFQENQITGNGMYLWPDGSTYDGQVLNGIRHGTGTFRHPRGLAYTGEWRNGKRNGLGRTNYGDDDSSYYYGEWRDNIRHGNGFRHYPSGNTYEGAWFLGQRHGQGVMNWFDRGETYIGQWENNIQHGMGQHTWYVRRSRGSQYPLRNVYSGELVQGKRHGYGTFIYPNGARYEGNWDNDLKQGWGKFTFKNGRIYEGQFQCDRITEFPQFTMNSHDTPRAEDIRTRTPTMLEMENRPLQSRGGTAVTFSPSFQLYTEHILQVQDIAVDVDDQKNQIMNVLLRNYGIFRRVYDYYSFIGNEASTDNTFVMNQMQLWRFLKDCKLHHGDTTLADIDRLLAKSFHHSSDGSDIHDPTRKVIFFQFVNYLVTIANYFYGPQFRDHPYSAAESVLKLLDNNVMSCSTQLNGFLFSNPMKAPCAMKYAADCYEIFQHICRHRNPNNKEYCLKLRHFLLFIKELNLLNTDLTAKNVVNVLCFDDPRAADNDFVDLEREMIFLEFFEALLGCALVFCTRDVLDRAKRELDKLNGEDTTSSKAELSPDNEASNLSEKVDTDAPTADAQTAEELSPDQNALSPEKRSAPAVAEKKVEEKSSPDKMSRRNTRAGNGPSTRSQRGSQKLQDKTLSTTPAGPSTVENSENVDDIQSKSGLSPGGMKSNSFGKSENEAGGELNDNSNEEMGSTGNADDIVTVETVKLTEEEQIDLLAREMNLWLEQLDYFFNVKFFPAANRYNYITNRLFQ